MPSISNVISGTRRHTCSVLCCHCLGSQSSVLRWRAKKSGSDSHDDSHRLLGCGPSIHDERPCPRPRQGQLLSNIPTSSSTCSQPLPFLLPCAAHSQRTSLIFAPKALSASEPDTRNARGFPPDVADAESRSLSHRGEHLTLGTITLSTIALV